MFMFSHMNTEITLQNNKSLSLTNTFSYNHMCTHKCSESRIANNLVHNFI